MKLKNIAIIGSVALLLGSCSDQEVYNADAPSESVRVFGHVNNTRVSFTPEGTVTHATWENGDKIGVYGSEQQNLCYSASVGGTGNVEFTPQATRLQGMDGTSVAAYYPYSETVKEMMVAMPATNKYKVGEMKPFVYAVNNISGGSVSLQFKHAYAYLKFTVTQAILPDYIKSKTLESILITSSSNKFGLVDGMFDLKEQSIDVRNAVSEINIDAAKFDLSKDELVCYVPVLPQEGKQTLNFRFYVQEDNIEENVFSCQKYTSEKGLMAGYVYNVSLVQGEEQLYSSDEQKAKIEAVGKKFVSYFQASEFNALKNTARYIKNTFCKEKSQAEVVTHWWDDCINAITIEGSTSTDQKVETYGDTTYEYTDYYYYTYRDLTRLYDAANFVGHFTVNENNEWVKEEGDFNDLQFTCTDENGETCVANLTASGDSKKVYIGESTDEEWGDWRLDSERDEEIFEYDEEGNIINSYLKHYKEYSVDIAEDTYKHYVYLPEKVTVTITQGGKELVKSVVNTNLSIVGDEFDLTKHDFDVTVETYVNDFEVLVSKATYAANKSVQAACKLNKNGQNLVTFSAYTGIAFSGSLYDESVELESMDNATFETDILHELQIKGSTSDGKLLSDHVADAMDNDTNLDMVNEKLAEANKLLDIGLYFDGQSTKQCEVKLEAFEDTEWYDDVPHYSWEPVLSFPQEGTTYSFASFFNEDDFHELINLSWDVYDDFGNLVHQFDRDY